MGDRWKAAATAEQGAVRRELTDHHLARITGLRPTVHAFLEVTAEAARLCPDRIDAGLAAGEPCSPGRVPLGDQGQTLHQGDSAPPAPAACWRTLFPAPYESTVTERLLASRRVLWVKPNLGRVRHDGSYGRRPPPLAPGPQSLATPSGCQAAVAAVRQAVVRR